jgi:hypothetical protein
MAEPKEYMPRNYTLDKTKDCLRCEQPGVIVWNGKVRKLCPRCFLQAMEQLFAEYDPGDWRQEEGLK